MADFYNLHTHKSNYLRKHVFLNSFQLKALGLTPNENFSLHVGIVEFPVKLALGNHQSSDSIFITEDLKRKIPYELSGPIRLIYKSNNKIALGPSLGVTVSKKTWQNIDNSTILRKIAMLAISKGVLLYCFRLNNVDWDNNEVKSYYFNPLTNKWVKKILPIPHVIHDRGSTPKPSSVDSYSKRGSVYDLHWVNTTRTFGKWETYGALSKKKDTDKHIPETELLNLINLKKYLNKYKYCFVKHNYGRNGRQVIRLEKSEGKYICRTGGNTVNSWKFTSLTKLLSFIQKKINGKTIIQQGIILAQIDRCPFDMRILAQKNQHNHWDVTALNFRIGASGAIITNFSAGAKDVLITPGDQLLHQDLNWESLNDLVLNLSKNMEKAFGPLGEIGFDIALDMDGKLWLIEANSRPSSIAYRNATEEQSKLIFGRPLDYTAFLVRDHYS